MESIEQRLAELETQFANHNHDGLNSDSVPTKTLMTNTGEVSIFESDPPIIGAQLVATDSTHAVWKSVPVNPISFDNSTNNAGQVNTSFTNAGNLLFVGVLQQAGSTCSAVTYDGVSMTLVGSNNGAGGIGSNILYLFMLKAPAIGTHTVTVTETSGTASTMVVIASYFNCSTITEPDNSSNGGATTTTTYSQSVTSIANNCWAILVSYYNDGGGVTGTNPTAGTNTVIRTQTQNRLTLADSNNPKSPAGSITENLLSVSQIYIGIMASFSPQ